MLRTHLRNKEVNLLSQYKTASIAGHNLNKGTPREAFVKDFLIHHLPSLLDVGSGEIIDYESRPGEKRNQIDVVVFQKTFPKLHLADDIYCFLVESVSATIEVKSVLDKAAIAQAMAAANKVKMLKRSRGGGIEIGGCRSDIFSGLVAYSGPDNMELVGRWLKECEAEMGYSNKSRRDVFCKNHHVSSPTLDSVVLLGKGVAYSCGQACGVSVGEETWKDRSWCTVESEYDNLFFYADDTYIGISAYVWLGCA